MMYFKTLQKRLIKCGWEQIDEGHGNLIPHYYKFAHPSDDANDDRNVIEITAASNKDGTPGKITGIWQGGKPCRV